ncbi:MAG: hypothetical protein HND27_05210 [Bacteroidetes bacterium]|nr:hypothetical protein [Bacteroidota bacterium]NOG95159.1 hypothetical protein [Bacteroidota bacterium]
MKKGRYFFLFLIISFSCRNESLKIVDNDERIDLNTSFDIIEKHIYASEYDSAQIKINQVLLIDSNNVKLKVLQGILYKSTEHFSKSLFYFNQLLQNDRVELPYIYAMRAEVYAKLNRKKSAFIDLDSLLSISQDTFNYFFVRSNVHLFLREFDSSLYCINQLENDFNNKGLFFYQKAFIYLSKGDSISFCKNYQKAIENGFEVDSMFNFCNRRYY